MNYKLPFYAVSKAIYNALSKKGQLEWFDSAVPIAVSYTHLTLPTN